jgi:O-antigen/teichoic acid export membrane protein
VNYLGEARRRVPLAMLDVALAIGLTAILLPTVGLLGAAYASDVGALFYVPLHVWIARKFIHLPLRPLFMAGARGLLAAAAMAGVLLLFGTSHLSVLDWIAGGVLGTAAFAAVLLVTREVTVEDLRALPRWIRRRGRRG